MDRNSVVRGADGIYSFQNAGYDQADDEEQLAAAMWIDYERLYIPPSVPLRPVAPKRRSVRVQ